ncbi:MAG: MATE family efflux transporter [Bacteroidales bacterium]|nr:MATE family efflux transporter [Bacteroidales bacterium]
MDKIKELSEARIGPLMLKYFIPSFIGVFVNALYNIVDRIFIGQGVGAEALSGVSVIFPIMLIMMAFGMLIGIGTGVMVSINLGKKDKNRAEKTLGNSVILILIVSALIMIIGFALKRTILESFGATEEIIGYANDYLNIILWGVVFQVAGFSLNNVIRAEGNAKIAMYSMIISAGTNLILDPIFIFVFDMGVKGAAYATVISMFILLIWVVLHFRSHRSVIKLKKEYMSIDFSIVKDIVAIGMAPFSMQIANSVVQGLLNKKLITYGGDLAAGAMGIINSVITLVIMAIVAVNMASQPIIGFNFGAKNSGRVKEALRIALIAATIISTSAAFIIELMPHFIIRLFNNSSDVLYQITHLGLRTVVIVWPVIGFQVVAGSLFQSIGKAKIAMFLSLLRQVIVLIPLLYILPGFMGLKGIWTAFPLADFTSAVIVAIFLWREWRKLGDLELAVVKVK